MHKGESKAELLSQNLRLFASMNDFNNDDISTILGVSKQAVQSWTSMRSMPDARCQRALEKLFGVKFDKICSRAMTVKLISDKSLIAEDVYPYNAIVEAFLGYNYINEYEESDTLDINLDYREISLFDYNTAFNRRLTDREKIVITLRFRDGFRLDDVGARLGVTRERIRQIEHKALRKLNRDLHYIIDDKRKLESVREENAKLRAYILNIESSSTAKEECPCLDTLIEDLDFSIRTYNCLKRAYINTLHDLVTYDKDFINIRNLGRKSLEEIIYKVTEMHTGYEFDRDLGYFVKED